MPFLNFTIPPTSSPPTSSKELLRENGLSFIELEKSIANQTLTLFPFLNAVRNRSITEDHLHHLNSRVHPAPSEDVIVLTSVNALSRGIK